MARWMARWICASITVAVLPGISGRLSIIRCGSCHRGTFLSFPEHISTYVPSFVCYYLFHKLRDNLQNCFDSIQKADQARHYFSSPTCPASVLRFPKCHSRRASSSSPADRSTSKCGQQVDKVAGSYCQRPIRILFNTWPRYWARKPRDIKLFKIFRLTYIITGIPTCECDFCVD